MQQARRSHHSFTLAGTLVALLVASSAFLQTAHAQTSSTASDKLKAGFENPPNSARPRVWWHWMNGNITKEGIKLDLEWMHRVGIGGFQNFDAALSTPQVVEKRLSIMTPEWKEPSSTPPSWPTSSALKMPSPALPAGARPAAPGSSPPKA